MPTRNLYLLGTAIDGPRNTPILVTSLEDAQRTFGGRFTEKHTIGATDTTLWLAYRAKQNSIRTFSLSSGRLIPVLIYNVARDDTNHNLITFDALGESTVVVFSYEREYEENEVLRFYEEVSGVVGGANVYLVRISGTSATTSLPGPDALALITLYAKGGGELYNKISLVATASTLTFTFPEGMCASTTRSYTLSATKTIQELADEINAHTEVGLNAVYATVASGTTPAVVASSQITAATYTFTGGDDELALDVGAYSDPGSMGYDAFTNNLFYGIQSIYGTGADVIVCPLPLFLKRAGFYDQGVTIMAYDWDTYQFITCTENFSISGTYYATTPNTLAPTTINLPAATDGGLAKRVDIGTGQYSVTAPSTITIGARTATFQHWIQYGSVQTDSFNTNRMVFKTSSNPIQITPISGEVVLVAVYRTATLSSYRTFYSLPGTQSSQTWNSAWAFINANSAAIANQYDLEDLSLVINEYLAEERQDGALPLFIFPTLDRAKHPSTT